MVKYAGTRHVPCSPHLIGLLSDPCMTEAMFIILQLTRIEGIVRTPLPGLPCLRYSKQKVGVGVSKAF